MKSEILFSETQKFKQWWLWVLLFIFTLLISSCFQRELRGKVRKSSDKETYLVFDEVWGEIFVDGEKWNFKIGEKGKILPGEHSIDGLIITIKKGTTFHFNYWGP
jgi:hypothetical protein